MPERTFRAGRVKERVVCGIAGVVSDGAPVRREDVEKLRAALAEVGILVD